LPFKRNEQIQASYFICIFSILGKLAKIDGRVTRDEIAVVEEFIAHMNMPEREKQFAKQVFNEAKQSAYTIEDFAEQFYMLNKQQPAVMISFLDVLFKLAAADGTLHSQEEEALKRIKSIFRISDQHFEGLKGVYFKDVEKYYKILNCTSSSSDQKIKSNYKKLVKEFHPDTIISKGLPEEFVQFATDRFQEIQGAYEKIKEERGL
jgi:DnaJ like chaperone protein